MGGINGGLADLLNVRGMSKPSERVAVKEFEDLGIAASHSEQQNAFGKAGGKDRGSAFELLVDVFPAVSDGFKPPIGFLDHAFKS